jgi:simple sugar transport system ATP-binding protein
MQNYILEMKNIHKIYSVNNVTALKNATLKLEKGKVHALVGENGAGKTTLMKILYGIEKMDSGEIILRGKDVKIDNAKTAFELGIGMVHQHFKLIDDFNIAENISLGIEKKNKYGMIEFKKIQNEISDLSCKSGLDLDPCTKVRDLSIGEKQKVEILRTLYRGAEIIILDEPTSVLTEQEIQRLFNTIKMLKNQGKTIIFISHKLEEVKKISDQITVLRNGETVFTGDTAKTNIEEISRLMVGENITFEKLKCTDKKGENIFSIEELYVKDMEDQYFKVKGISLNIKAGEIVGLAGVDGNGQKELIRAITGLSKIEKGSVFLNKKNISDYSTRMRREAGMSYIPKDRVMEGSSPESNILENEISTKYFKDDVSKNGWINREKSLDLTKFLIKEYDIKTPGINIMVGMLSGGNIQKVVISRELSSEPELLIACEPTWGLDIRSQKFVYDQLEKIRNEGKSIFLISGNLDEIMYLSDRILVIYDGEIVKNFDNHRNLTKMEIGKYMMGLHKKEKPEKECDN